MGILNAGLTRLFDLLFWPFRAAPPVWALTVVSVAVGVLMLWIFGKVSNQAAIKVSRDRIRGNLIGIRLFGDDLLILFRLQARIVRQVAKYLMHSALPIVVLLVPVVLILTQLNLRFSVEPLAEGRPALVKVTLRDPMAMREPVRLEVPPGVVLETPGVRVDDPEAGKWEVAWRIRADVAGDHLLRVTSAGETVDKSLRVGGGWGAISAIRTGKNFWEKLLWPGERPIDSTRIESVTITYATLPLKFLWWNVNAMPSGWLVYFFIASVVAGFAFRRVLDVEI